jgi:hypothetical protein
VPAQAVEAPLATPLSVSVAHEPALRVAAASSSTQGQEVRALPAAPPVTLQQPSTTLSKTPAHAAKALKHGASRRTASAERQPTKAVQMAMAGPHEVCAGRSVFTRGYCVQRRCDEARYRNHPQCVRLRQEMHERYRTNG